MSTLELADFAAIGTRAVVIAARPGRLAAAVAAVRMELDRVDAACSRFRPDSELTAVNRSAGRWVAVGELLVDHVEIALGAARQTDGLVDPTIGRSLRLLGYDRDFALVGERAAAPAGGPVRAGASQPPLGERPVAVEAVAGWRMVDVDRRHGRIRVPPGVELDLGATAKARTADLGAERAWEVAGCGVLVSLGGDIATAGEAPEGGWVVMAAEDAAAPADGPAQEVRITDGAVATSSSTVRVWRRSDCALHHIIDPSTGGPASAPWRTVTVAAATCVDANTAATAALVVGADAPRWLEERQLPARLVRRDGLVRTVWGWPEEPQRG